MEVVRVLTFAIVSIIVFILAYSYKFNYVSITFIGVCVCSTLPIIFKPSYYMENLQYQSMKNGPKSKIFPCFS
jgi:hypothetical protein